MTQPRDDDYTPEALDRDAATDDDAARAARADRLTWSPGDLIITPPPTDGDDQ